MSEGSAERDLILSAMAQWQTSLGRIERDLSEIRRQVVRNEVAIGQLTIKASLWGAVAGAFPALLVGLYVLLK